MLHESHAFSGYSVSGLDAAETFYKETLGLPTTRTPMGLELKLTGGTTLFLYEKPNHEPATFTVLNFPVDDIDAAVAALKDKGIALERYEGLTDEDGIARGKASGQGPDIAWFKDPAGNILSVLQS